MMQDLEEDKGVQEKLQNLFTVIHQFEDERVGNEHNLANIAKTHQRIQHNQKLSPYFKTKLKGLYNTAMQDAECEENLLRKALDTIHSIRAVEDARRIAARHANPPREPMRRGTLMLLLQLRAESLPLWVGKRKETPPPLCGAFPAKPNYIAKVHDMVAASVNSSNNEDMWIMARVVKYFPNTRKYEIEDVDEEQTERHILHRKKVIPLPLMRANPETNPEALFPSGTLVLAAYPQATCLYPAIIKSPPAKPRDGYTVVFKDPSYPDGIDLTQFKVFQRYVVSFREGRKK